MIKFWTGWLAAMLVWAGWGEGARAQALQGPAIEHTPVTVAVRGQPLTIRARVPDAPGQGSPVKLFYTVSKDAAPYESAMQHTGAGVYIGTIPASVLSAADQITYYLAAESRAGAVRETPWYTIRLRGAPASELVGAPGERPKWVMPALIAGGVALVAGGTAIALSDSGGSSSGGGDSNSDFIKRNAGSYSGTATVSVQEPSGASVRSYPVNMTLASDGTLVTPNLSEQGAMSTRVSGTSFLFTATLSGADRTGEIRYVGTVFEGRIAGTIEGSARLAGGGTAVYSGTFSVVRAGGAVAAP